MYFNDIEVTKMLEKEIEEYNQGIRKSCSNALASEFINLVENILKSSKYFNYTNDWKNDFRSLAYYYFVKYWHKFDKDKLKKDGGGAHTFFTTIAISAIHTEINKKKREKENMGKLIDAKIDFLNNNKKIMPDF